MKKVIRIIFGSDPIISPDCEVFIKRLNTEPLSPTFTYGAPDWSNIEITQDDLKVLEFEKSCREKLKERIKNG